VIQRSKNIDAIEKYDVINMTKPIQNEKRVGYGKRRGVSGGQDRKEGEKKQGDCPGRCAHSVRACHKLWYEEDEK
jgi:hypothetical protein